MENLRPLKAMVTGDCTRRKFGCVYVCDDEVCLPLLSLAKEVCLACGLVYRRQASVRRAGGPVGAAAMQASGGQLVSNVSDDERLVGRSKKDDGEDSKMLRVEVAATSQKEKCTRRGRFSRRSKMEMAGRTFFLFIQTQQ